MLRQPRKEDWEQLICHMFDSKGRFFFNNEIDMPTDVDQYRIKTEFTDPEKLPYTCFAIENNAGKHVGIANLFCVDERNGTFGPIGILFGTHGTALSAILDYYERDFGIEGFMNLYNWMPYVVHAVFDETRLVSREDVLIVNRGY